MLTGLWDNLCNECESKCCILSFPPETMLCIYDKSSSLVALAFSSPKAGHQFYSVWSIQYAHSSSSTCPLQYLLPSIHPYSPFPSEQTCLSLVDIVGISNISYGDISGTLYSLQMLQCIDGTFCALAFVLVSQFETQSSQPLL